MPSIRKNGKPNANALTYILFVFLPRRYNYLYNNNNMEDDENEVPNQMQPDMPPPPPHPFEPMWQAYMRLGLAPIVAHDFINNEINTIEQLHQLSVEDINCLVKKIHRDSISSLFIPFGA